MCLLKPMMFTKIKWANHDGHRTSPHWGWLPPCADVCWKPPSAAPKSCRVRSRVRGRWPALYGTITMFFVGVKKKMDLYIYLYIYMNWSASWFDIMSFRRNRSFFFRLIVALWAVFKIEIPGLSMGKPLVDVEWSRQGGFTLRLLGFWWENEILKYCKLMDFRTPTRLVYLGVCGETETVGCVWYKS